MSLICGDHTYGSNHIAIFQWGEGTKIQIGKYCSIADNVKAFQWCGPITVLERIANPSVG